MIGGGDSLSGALDERGMPTTGVPCTIDNDVPGTELSVGVDTALNTAVIDRVKDAAASQRRAMVVEFCEFVNGAGSSYQADLTVLGHIQSGGSPTAYDRILAACPDAARPGAAAVDAIADGDSGAMVGISGESVERVPLRKVVSGKRPLDPQTYELAGVLSSLPR